MNQMADKSTAIGFKAHSSKLLKQFAHGSSSDLLLIDPPSRFQ